MMACSSSVFDTLPWHSMIWMGMGFIASLLMSVWQLVNSGTVCNKAGSDMMVHSLSVQQQVKGTMARGMREQVARDMGIGNQQQKVSNRGAAWGWRGAETEKPATVTNSPYLRAGMGAVFAHCVNELEAWLHGKFGKLLNVCWKGSGEQESLPGGLVWQCSQDFLNIWPEAQDNLRTTAWPVDNCPEHSASLIQPLPIA